MKQRVIVVGGGWAGLSCALELLQAGHPVTLLEAAPQLGGRARSIEYRGLRVDNGQHLILGAYHHTLRLLRRLGKEERELFQRLPLRLHLLRHDAPPITLRLPRYLPAPLHLAWGLLGLRGLGLRDRFSALAMALRLRRIGFTLDSDRSVAELLQQQAQSAPLIESLWEPLCLATLNTPIAEASAQLFLHVLRDSFSHRARDADLLLPRADLGQLLPQLAEGFLQQRGGELQLGRRVRGLLMEEGRLLGVRTGEREYLAGQVVLACPPKEAARLLRSEAPLQPLADRLAAIDSYPITTVYLRYPQSVSLDYPLYGLLGSLGQWVVDRAHCGQAGLLAVVISGPGPHEALDKQTLAERIEGELAACLPDLPACIEHWVVRERRATFRATPANQRLRPSHRTPLPGLWLTGDYTRGPYPATLEGAVQNGVQCARRIHAPGGSNEPEETAR